MQTTSSLARILATLLVVAVMTGCGGGDKKSYSNGEAANGNSNGDEAPEILLEPFDPPTLEELEAKVEWEEMPVVDSLELMRERQSTEPILATVSEALALRNTSKETNDKILSALGRMPATDAEPDWDATMNRHVRIDMKSTNPLMGSSTVEFDVTGLYGFGLMGFDWDFNPFALAENVVSWQSSTDRLYDKIVIRDDLVWSDGTPITAHDVVFSFKTIMNPRIPIPAVRSGTDEIRWIEAYDDHTLVYFHKQSLATNVWNVNFPVIPKHIYEKSIEEDPLLNQSEYHVNQEEHPISGGPYLLTSRTRNQEIVLTRREDWYMHNGKQVRSKPYFKEIRLKIIEDSNTALLALQKGEIDELELKPELWTTRTGDEDFYRLNTKATGLEWVNFHFAWNCKSDYFDDKRVRQAMSHAFDHDELLNELLYGLFQPSTGPFHPTAWMATKKNLQPYKQNLEKAEQLLAEAGWEDHDGDGILDKKIDGRTVQFQFSILCANMQERVDFCTLLKENLDQIGIICNVKPVEFTVLQEKCRAHEFDAVFGGWGTGADPDTSENIYGTRAGRNYGEYSNPEVDKLFAAGKKEFDREKRAAIYAKIHELMWDDQPYTWLYYRNSFFGFNKRVRGYVFSPRGPYGYSPGFSNIWKAAQ